MLISTSLRFVFVANSKTASTSIEYLLSQYSDIKYQVSPRRKHISLADALKERPDFSNYFKFGIMRDPLEWICSWYRYRTGNRVGSALPRDMTFPEFWARKDWNIVHPKTGRKRLQKDKFCNSNGVLISDIILNMENLSSDFERICVKLGVDGKLPHKNASKKTSRVEDLVPADLQAEIRAFYEDDYAIFDNLDQLNEAGFARLEDMSRSEAQ